jgi:hypothetical protein
MIIAKEHATFFKTIPRIIKWHNDQISHTAILPIIGITREAMIKPIKAKRVNGNDEIKSTTIRNEMCNSGLFNSIHSSRQTDDEGRWILVVTNKIHLEAATNFFNTLAKSVYGEPKTQIQNSKRIIMTPMPMIEDREQT